MLNQFFRVLRRFFANSGKPSGLEMLWNKIHGFGNLRIGIHWWHNHDSRNGGSGLINGNTYRDLGHLMLTSSQNLDSPSQSSRKRGTEKAKLRIMATIKGWSLEASVA